MFGRTRLARSPVRSICAGANGFVNQSGNTERPLLLRFASGCHQYRLLPFAPLTMVRVVFHMVIQQHAALRHQRAAFAPSLPAPELMTNSRLGQSCGNVFAKITLGIVDYDRRGRRPPPPNSGARLWRADKRRGERASESLSARQPRAR